ncbi:MAG: hypothetical protein KJ893_11350 [Candidatus Omnitrophica bacterium]|nr:hypothetical protein [Candidatus Omnitrophota bacterium]MBU4478493.1 hypothetical protein [Candidatus Omnitrophota bacterium]MCG2704091.1 hypothetical protein [Candidatus Omnitrophota bacterium]
MNRTVFLLAVLLVMAAVNLTTVKLRYGDSTTHLKPNEQLWRVNLVMNLTGQGKAAKVRFTLPKDTERQFLYNEHFDDQGLNFYIRERSLTKNRIGFWRAELLESTKLVQYTFSCRLNKKSYAIPEGEKLPKDALKKYPPEFAVWLDSSRYIQADDKLIKAELKKIIGRKKEAAVVVRNIYDFIQGKVSYRSEKGSKDALKTLEKLTADCGGQARLFVALCRAAKIPSRIVGGLVIKKGVKNITHVWAESHIGGQWIPFDVVNKYYAFIPDNYLEFYRGDYSLFKHTGLSKFEYFFIINKTKVPPVDNPWSLYVLPVHFHNIIMVLLLLPVGTLVVSFFRNVIGISTLGTFSPVLLALAFREISLEMGLLSVTVIVLLGWLVRKILDGLKILLIPKLSVIITMVVILMLALMLIGFHFGTKSMLYISLFPIVIMSWIIERFTIIQIEDGVFTALRTMVGTTLVTVVAYYVMGISILQSYLFSFPEGLLIIMAVLLLLGRYTGMRFMELFRFKDLIFKRGKRS